MQILLCCALGSVLGDLLSEGSPAGHDLPQDVVTAWDQEEVPEERQLPSYHG